jgi:post-segregation antitoxin (ccd killing protein)
VKAETVEQLRSGEVTIHAVATTLTRAEREKEREKRRKENAEAAAGVKDVREVGVKRAIVKHSSNTSIFTGWAIGLDGV